MTESGFLVLLQRHLQSSYSKNGLNIDFLFVNLGTKIIVHGPGRTPTTPKVIATITSKGPKKEILITTATGTSFDYSLLQKTIENFVEKQPETKVIIKPQ